MHVPAALIGVVEGVFGLDDRRLARPHIAYEKIQHEQMTAGDSPVSVLPPTYPGALTPQQGRRALRLPGEPRGRADHRHPGVRRRVPHVRRPRATSAATGCRCPASRRWASTERPTTPGGDDYSVETALDISCCGASAPGAALVVYIAPWSEQGWVDVVTTAVHDTTHRISALSISYGWPEGASAGGLTWTAAAIRAVGQTFAEAAALGVSVFVSSGDHGASCGFNDHARVEYPGSDPMVTSCGGTVITGVSGGSFGESVWNEGSGWATGGGVSELVPHPALPGLGERPARPARRRHRSRRPRHRGQRGAGQRLPAVRQRRLDGTRRRHQRRRPALRRPRGPAERRARRAGRLPQPGALRQREHRRVPRHHERQQHDRHGRRLQRATRLGRLHRPGQRPRRAAAAGGARDRPAAPALREFGGTLRLMWKGFERDDSMWTSALSGPSSWSPQTRVDGIWSSIGPSLAPYNGGLYAAWKGAGQDQGALVQPLRRLVVGAAAAHPERGQQHGPRSWRCFNGRLYAAWKGAFDDQAIWYSSFDGSSWAPQQRIPNVATSVGPCLAYFKRRPVRRVEGAGTTTRRSTTATSTARRGRRSG